MSRDMHPMEAARAIAAEMYANAVQHEIATPCEPSAFDECGRLLRDYRIATKQRAEASDRMSKAARAYEYQAFESARDERNYHDQTISILRGKLRELGITQPDSHVSGGAL